MLTCSSKTGMRPSEGFKAALHVPYIMATTGEAQHGTQVLAVRIHWEEMLGSSCFQLLSSISCLLFYSLFCSSH